MIPCDSYYLLLYLSVAISEGRNRSVLFFPCPSGVGSVGEWVGEQTSGYFPPVNTTSFVGEILVAPVLIERVGNCVNLCKTVTYNFLILSRAGTV